MTTTLFKYPPIDALLHCGHPAIEYFAKRDLCHDAHADISTLWQLPEAQKILRKQQPNGGWHYPGGNPKIRSPENYDLIETFRNLGFLVECYGFNKQHPAIAGAADFLMRSSTREGDIRGILGNQYAPYYTAAMMELLIKAGYESAHPIESGFRWLSHMRQHDGGWAIPLRTVGKTLTVITAGMAPIAPDRKMPSSHMVTGMVLRAYAAHPRHRHDPLVATASGLLCNSLFARDKYPDRSSPDFWLRFSFPFWFTDLISALDTLSILGVDCNDPNVEKAVFWLLDQQQSNGLWNLKILKNGRNFPTAIWLSLAICRIVQRLYDHK